MGYIRGEEGGFVSSFFNIFPSLRKRKSEE